MKNVRAIGLAAMILCLAASQALAQVPAEVNYQGRVMKNGAGYSGIGSFKFALCDSAGSTSHWSNDMTSANCGEPAATLGLPVSKGLYEVSLGDTGTMAGFPANLFDQGDLYLRVWFGEGSTVEQLDPLQKVTSVFYAMNAGMLMGMTPGELGGAPPNIIIVAPQGGDTTTIAGGLLMANTVGDYKVWVAPGVYSENVPVVPDRTTLECMRARSCVVDFQGGQGFTLMGAEDVRIKGFEMRAGMDCVRIDPESEHVEITDNYFADCYIGVNVTSGTTTSSLIYIRHNEFGSEGGMGMVSTGVSMQDVESVWIEDNIFSEIMGGDGRGIDASMARILRIRNNLFSAIEGTPESAAVSLQDSSTAWVENNVIHSIMGTTSYGIAARFTRTLFIRHNDIVQLNPMGGSTAIGIYLEEGQDAIVEGNMVRDFTSNNSYGILVKDQGDYRLTDNKIYAMGMVGSWTPNSWGIAYRNAGGVMPAMYAHKQMMMDNQLTKCHNGILLDYGMMMEMMPLADKVIKGNVILDGDSTGFGIQAFEVDNVQVIENKVVNYDLGMDVNHNMVTPGVFHIMRNELWRNQTLDLNIINFIGGTYRVMYDFMDNYTRPSAAASIEGANLNSAGGVP